MREIPLTKGFVAIVDEEDFAWVSQWSWSASATAQHVYAKRRFRKGERGDGPVTMFLHRALLGATRGQVVDHISGDTLDNRRANLRLCSAAENSWNKRWVRPSVTSQYRGVHREDVKWAAHVTAHGVRHRGGRFASEEEAARAFDKLARQHHGAFAVLNFPDEAVS